jgi:hypothetical protein
MAWLMVTVSIPTTPVGPDVREVAVVDRGRGVPSFRSAVFDDRHVHSPPDACQPPQFPTDWMSSNTRDDLNFAPNTSR